MRIPLFTGNQRVPINMSLQDHQSECVILLHGLARTYLSMTGMQSALEKKGYAVFNINYPSRKLPIAELATIAIEQGLSKCHQCNLHTIHFVTHSLGGILVRQYTEQKHIPGLHRVVMLGPPNQGSEAVDKLKNLPGFSLINGPAGLQLGTDDEDLPKQLGAVDFELGVIAGKKSLNPVLSSLLPGQDDGKVTVNNTRVAGMSDFITLPVNHTFMMKNQQTIQQTLYFLEHGHFNHRN